MILFWRGRACFYAGMGTVFAESCGRFFADIDRIQQQNAGSKAAKMSENQQYVKENFVTKGFCGCIEAQTQLIKIPSQTGFSGAKKFGRMLREQVNTKNTATEGNFGNVKENLPYRLTRRGKCVIIVEPTI